MMIRKIEHFFDLQIPIACFGEIHGIEVYDSSLALTETGWREKENNA